MIIRATSQSLRAKRRYLGPLYSLPHPDLILGPHLTSSRPWAEPKGLGYRRGLRPRHCLKLLVRANIPEPTGFR